MKLCRLIPHALLLGLSFLYCLPIISIFISGFIVPGRYLKALLKWDGSNGYPQSLFSIKNKKNNVYLCTPQFYYIKVGYFKEVKIIQACFRDGASPYWFCCCCVSWIMAVDVCLVGDEQWLAILLKVRRLIRNKINGTEMLLLKALDNDIQCGFAIHGMVDSSLAVPGSSNIPLRMSSVAHVQRCYAHRKQFGKWPPKLRDYREQYCNLAKF